MTRIDNAYSKFDLNLLRAAVALYDERSVSGAAKRLGLTQSGASRALARLRESFGDPLFLRTGSGVKATPRAEALVDAARGVLAAVRQNVFVDTRFNPLASSTVFTFALHEISELLLYPKLIEALHSFAPKSRIRAVYPTLNEIVRGLERGEIDIAIGPSHPEFQRNSLLKQMLFDSKPVCLLRSDHLVRGGHLSLEEFRGLKHIKITADHNSLEQWRTSSGRKLHVSHSIFASHYLCLPSIIEACDAVVTVPEDLALFLTNAYSHLKVVNGPFSDVPVRYYQFWHSRFHSDPRNRWIRELVKLQCSVRNCK